MTEELVQKASVKHLIVFNKNTKLNVYDYGNQKDFKVFDDVTAFFPDYTGKQKCFEIRCPSGNSRLYMKKFYGYKLEDGFVF